MPRGLCLRGFQVKALGEIAIRCENVDEMMKFYRDIIGLEVLSGKEGDALVFFRISPGHGGHTTVLAFFARDAGRTDLHAQSICPLYVASDPHCITSL